MMKRNIVRLIIAVTCLVLAVAGVNLTPMNAASEVHMAKIGTNFWRMGGDTPFRYSWEINWDTAYEEGFNVWTDEFIESIKPYSVLRFMDWGLAYESQVLSPGSRKKPTDKHGNDVLDVAYEWMIDLGNRVQKDIWLCVPYPANDAYVKELAAVVKEKLNPDLKCYIEYSNETWNYENPKNYCKQKAQALNLPGYSNGNDNYKAEVYNIYRSFQIFDIFEEEFGDEMSDRIVKVCAIGGEWEDFRNQMESAYKKLTADTSFNPNNQRADMMAIAPYVGHNLDGSSATITTQFKNAVDSVYTSVLHGKAIANRLGLRYATYEGGQHLTNNADLFSRNPGIYGCYTYMFEKFAPEFELFMHYANSGIWSAGGAWGAKNATKQSIEDAHKYRALVDFINKYHPAPEVTAIPSAEASETVSTDSLITDSISTETPDVLSTVPPDVVDVEKIELDVSKMSLFVGQERKLSVNIYPENAADKNVTFSSSNSDIADVNEEGTVKALKAGKVIITVTAGNGVASSCEAEVIQPVKSIKFSKKVVKLKVGKTKKLAYKIKPANALKKLKWKSGNKKVATVSSAGKVKAKKKGKAVISVIALNGGTKVQAKCKIKVVKK